MISDFPIVNASLWQEPSNSSLKTKAQNEENNLKFIKDQDMLQLVINLY
jgi:hypothetical protein